MDKLSGTMISPFKIRRGIADTIQIYNLLQKE